MYRLFVAMGVVIAVSLSTTTALGQCGCDPVVTAYAPVAPSYTTYYAPAPYATYYAPPAAYVARYAPARRAYATYYAPRPRPYITYYRMPRRVFYW
ncbi:MAG: hypothetical protein U9N87_00895 [Planctomycetota bacterium]|nr:hypothetical protein [Planctomycetota bacterium]